MIEFSDYKAMYSSSCRECGNCFKSCYALQKTKYPIYKSIKKLYNRTATKKEIKKIRKFLRSCIYCKRCQVFCIQGLSLSERLTAMKYELARINPKYMWTPLNTPKILGKVMSARRYDYFVRNLTNELISEDFRKKFEKNREYKQREVVFFSGCGIQALENQFYTLLEIFDKLKMDYGLIEGLYNKSVCCGAALFDMGKFGYSVYMLKNLINEIRKYGTKDVLVYCATCYYSLKVLAPQLIDNYDLNIIHASGYIADLIEKKSMKSLLKSPYNDKKTITIHDSCHLAHSGDTESIRKLLNILPNIEISEMKHCKENAICDASCILKEMTNPFWMYKEDAIPIIGEAVDVNADVLCTLCPGCHAIISIFGDGMQSSLGLKKKQITVQNWVGILGEYLGIRMRDMLSYRFTHFFTLPFRDSGLAYLWKALKSLIRGYIGLKPPKN